MAKRESRKPTWPETRRANTPVTGTIAVGKAEGSGVEVLRGYAGTPDRFGLLKRYELRLPAFRRGVYFSVDWPHRWPECANRVLPWPCGERLGKFTYGGVFALFELRGGGVAAVLPVAGEHTLTWLNVAADRRLVLNFGTLGTAPVACDAPLLAWAVGPDAHAACRQAWAEALACDAVASTTVPRERKRYPEAFEHLGWCSWEEYHGSITSDLLVDAVQQIERSGLPIRYVLVDDGHLVHAERRLQSFEPNAKFPNGWKPLLRLRRPDGVRWMGVWHNFNGYWLSVAPDHQFDEALSRHLAELPTGAILPRNTDAAATAWYDAFIGSAKRHGFDFVKIDNQAGNLGWYIGSDNAVEAATRNSRALEAAVARDLDGLINCMAHGTTCVLNTAHSAATRCSIDYGMGDARKGKSHIWQSYHTMLWLGHTVWGDHDMFHSCDPASGRMMAVSKAMSGGPVYLSDAPTDFVPDYIEPLCYGDGRLLRPLAPACPLPDSVFIDAMKGAAAYGAIAPLAGGAAAAALYNLHDPDRRKPATATVTPDDYRHASALIQPYPGPWEVPEEGLLAYDWYARTARKLGRRLRVEIEGFNDRLLLLCPIRSGWAVVGRPDKYLSPAAVEVLSVEPQKVKVRLAESGPLAVWSERGAPKARGVAFTPAGAGLYVADLPVEPRPRTLTVMRDA